jgi:hypothetical protein
MLTTLVHTFSYFLSKRWRGVQVADALDLSDLSEALYSGKSRSAITQLACYEMSNACRVKPPPVPKVNAAAHQSATYV